MKEYVKPECSIVIPDILLVGPPDNDGSHGNGNLNWNNFKAVVVSKGKECIYQIVGEPEDGSDNYILGQHMHSDYNLTGCTHIKITNCNYDISKQSEWFYCSDDSDYELYQNASTSIVCCDEKGNVSSN